MKKLILYFVILFICSLSVLSFDDFEKDSKKNYHKDISAVADSRIFDANDIRTYFRNNGSFNRDPSTLNAAFVWPRSSSKTARYASGLWIGAIVGDDTLVTSCGYTYEYLPGFTDNNGDPAGYNDPEYKIYKLTRGIQDKDRANWPSVLLGNSDQGAPVFYDSLSGILRPVDFGKQTMFYSYTDSYESAHNAVPGSTAPLKADIKQLNFAENFPFDPLDYILFSQFIVINRSDNVWQNTVFSFWSDDDLGDAADDKIGCDSALKLGYTYNGTNNDLIYANSPPSVGTLLLKGALKYTGNPNDVVSYCHNDLRIVKSGYTDAGMSVFNGVGTSQNYSQSYRLMNGLTSSGESVINPVGGFPTKFYYTGDPVTNTGWNLAAQGDVRFFLSSGPVDVAPGDTQVLVIAQIIARGSDYLNSITKLREYSMTAKEYYRQCYYLDPVGITENISAVNNFSLSQNYPNPFNPNTIINYKLRYSAFLKLIIYDAIGNEVAYLVNERQDPGSYSVEWNAENFPSGVYYYTLTGGGISESGKMVLLR